MKKIFSKISNFLPILSATKDKRNTVGYRGEIFYFTSDPKDSSDITKSYKYFADGIIYVCKGIIQQAGDYNQLSKKFPGIKVIDYRGRIIMPGFIDTHVHYPQLEIVASYGGQLLDWLSKHTFPVEQKYSNYLYAKEKSKIFIKEMLNNGTTSAAVYAAVSPVSVDTLFSEALANNMRIITGKVLMDRNAPEYLLDTPKSAYQESKELIEKWHGKQRLLYAVTPRFAITSTNEQLEVVNKLLKEYPSVYMQTHLAENIDEVAFVKKLFPDSESYLDVYNRFGLVTQHSIFGHSIYLDENDFELLHDKGSSIAFCPSSNLFLGSGLFNLKLAQDKDVNIGFGTDIGAGDSMSILATMAQGYKVSNLRKSYDINYKDNDPLSSFAGFYYATLGAAKALSIDNYVGSLEHGKEADFIVLNPNTPFILEQKNQTDKTLEQRLFSLMMLADDRTIEHVYVYGKKKK